MRMPATRYDAGQGPRQCWECQGEGHFRRDCPKRTKRIAVLEALLATVLELRDEATEADEEENDRGLRVTPDT